MTTQGATSDAEMKAMARFAALLLALVAVTYWLLSLGFTTQVERHALRMSGALAVAVQLAGFAMIQWAGRDNALIGWGLGALLRGTVLVVYGLFFAKMLGLPLTAALVGFAVFLFVSMLLESLLLAHDR
ncbi:MAG: hypothetical protein H0U59_12050 [Gemmatimonadaceae bacterium]|nr:hypothetical protein [Gemmatimonadaceae bacterium]MDQ3243325.1 hypothetical protein [Gemmatimonadota bacterium]